MIDKFIPDPAIMCPYCAGEVTIWQGKPASGPALFTWKQGVPAPLSQNFDDDETLSKEGLESARLATEFTFYSGKCIKCKREFPVYDALPSGKCINGVWTETSFCPLHIANRLRDNWIQCESCLNMCLNIWQSNLKKTHDYCPDCNKLTTINWYKNTC